MKNEDKRPSQQGDANKPVKEKDLDKALADTFPASDPPAVTQGITGIPDSIQRKHDEAEKDSSGSPAKPK